MIASTSAFHGCHILSQKICHKFASCSIQSASDFHSITNFMGELLSTLNSSSPTKNWCFETRATSTANESHSEYTISYHDLAYKLPKNLSWLLTNPREVAKRPPSVNKKSQKKNITKNSFGVILEWRGVIVEEDDPELEPAVWYLLSLEEQKLFPSQLVLDEIEGMKTDQAISEVLQWSDDPVEIERIAARKELIYRTLRGKHYQLRDGTLDFLLTLTNFNVPIALVSDLPRKSLNQAVDSVGLDGYFDAIVADDDVVEGRPEPEMYELAARRIGIGPERCVVFGTMELSIDAARNAEMSCVAVASRHPVYELGAADHVVRWLDQVSIGELQTLAGGDPIGARARATHMEIVMEE